MTSLALAACCKTWPAIWRANQRPGLAKVRGVRHHGLAMPRRALLTLGLDEAGRGPAIGPLVLAAVALSTRAAAALTRAGLTDSKAFGAGPRAHTRRVELAVQVRELATFVDAEIVLPAEIDARVDRGELNALEREVAQRLIERAPRADRIVADGHRMFAPLTARYPSLLAVDRAEDKHAAVAAASVIAKTLRDDLYAAICAKYEPEFGKIAGGGYVNDATRGFLRAYAVRYGCLPTEARRSWPHPYVADLIAPSPKANAQLSLL